MTRRRIITIGIVVIVPALVLLAQNARKPSPREPLTDEDKKAGWISLFDGKSLDQWRNYNDRKLTPNAKWQAVDGTLVLTAPGGGDLITKEHFDSFELVLEYKISKAGNSGLMFHVEEGHEQPGMSGPEIQILDNVDGTDPTKAGWLYGLYHPADDPKTGKPVDATNPAGQWNRIRLLVDGAKGEVELNGVKYEAFEMWSEDWNQRVAKSKFVEWEDFGKARSGHICLQDHGSAVAFRNIKIKPIKAK